MHDWLSWNSARWELGREAVHAGIDPRDIEGGYEWNGWHGPDRLPPWNGGLSDAGLDLTFTKNNFWWVTGKYALAFSQQPGTVERDARPYALWLSPGSHRFLLLQRNQAMRTP
jgi:hypothetical protein